MTPTSYQKPEIRDSNDNIIQQGAFGKNTALSNATNDGWIDYVANDLEALNNNKADANAYLPLTGGTLTGALNIRANYPNIRLYNTLIERNVAPSSPYTTVEVCGYDKNDKATWGLYHLYNTDKANNIRLIAYKGTTADSSWTGIGVGYDGSGNAYTEAPTPAKASNDTNIATTAFVKTNLADYLPLSGGTMSGAIISNVQEIVKRSIDNSHVEFMGGTSYANGASLVLRGGNESPNNGEFQLKAQGGSSYKDFIGKPDGTLTWGGYNVITSEVTGNILEASGTIAADGTTIVDICSITQHEAGVWLVVGYVDLSTSVPNVNYNFNLTDGVQGTTIKNINGGSSGGASTSNILSLAKNAPVTLKGWLSASTQTNFRGRIRMVRLS